MSVIGVKDLSVSFGETVLLKNVTFSVNPGEKVAIVGVNGAGKSTLMRILWEREPAFTGEVFLSKDKSVGYLEQLSSLDPEMTVLEAGYSVFRRLTETEEKLRLLSEKMEQDPDPKLIASFAALQAQFQRDGGYEYKSLAKGTLIRLGFREMLDMPVGALSGGQKTTLQLALLLLEEPDILLLDEPTNHLDVKALEWLEEKLKSMKSTILVISHDRYFLDQVTEKTLEIENTHAKLYPASFTRYREMKKEEREIQERHYKNQQKEIARIEAFIEQQKRWNREKNIIAAESRQKALERMEKVERPENLPEELAFCFTGALESGEDVLSVKDLKKVYGSKVLFEHLDLEVKKRDRLVILGANGSGKSTLLQILAGNTPQSEGEYRYGYNVRLGYYDQYQHLNENGTVLEEIWNETDLSQTEVRKLLAAFLFKGDDVFKEIRVLSGGERARLVLAKLMQKKVNLLLLDEPTNHLDIESREALENAILSFDGTVIAVSHDRYFIRKIATRLLEFRGDESPSGHDLFSYNGTYESYLQYRSKKSADPAAAAEKKSSGSLSYEEQKQKKAMAQKRARRIEAIQKEIEESEARLSVIEKESENAASDYVLLERLYQEKAQLEEKCDRLLSEWNDLEEAK